MKNLILFLTALLALKSATAQTIIKSDDAHIHYMGRIGKKGPASELSWPGTSVKINFYGTSAKAVLQDEHANNFYNVIVDDKVIAKIHPDSVQKIYTLVSGLPAGNHSLELFKRSEWTMGKTWLYQFEVDGKILPAPETKKRKIEFYGNSITCGFANEDSSGKDRGTSPYENNYMSYAAITARHFNAEYSCIARSGIGVVISWFPQVMPEMYNLLDATNPKSLWDFKKYTPDVVVVNLFQNDSWLVKNTTHPQFKARFGTTPPKPEFVISAYRDFIKTIRAKYPNAQIICALGSMDATKTGSEWPGYIEKAVAGLADKKIYTHFFPYKNTNGHPNIKEQQAMADGLIAFIDGHVKW
jgi:hypothetical protein